MKNRTKMMKIAATAVLTVTLAASLTGCGTAEATNQEVTKAEETLVEGEAETMEETNNHAESEVTDEVASATYGNIVVFDEKVKTDYEFDFERFKPMDNEYSIESNIDIYYTGGSQAGYMKSGAVIQAYDGTEEWLRFYNPEKNDKFSVEFLLVKVEELKASTSDTVETINVLTAESLEASIIEAVNKAVEVNWADTPTSDMESITLTFDKYDENATSNLDHTILTKEGLGNYATFAVELVEDTETSCTFKVYYKDKIDWETYEENE